MFLYCEYSGKLKICFNSVTCTKSCVFTHCLHCLLIVCTLFRDLIFQSSKRKVWLTICSQSFQVKILVTVCRWQLQFLNIAEVEVIDILHVALISLLCAVVIPFSASSSRFLNVS